MKPNKVILVLLAFTISTIALCSKVFAGDLPPECHRSRQRQQCRIIPNLTTAVFARVEANIRDTRTEEERVPWTDRPVWGVQHAHPHGPRTLYSVDSWPLFFSEADSRWAKRYFDRPETRICSFSSFNSYGNADGDDDAFVINSEEHDGMQFFVR